MKDEPHYHQPRYWRERWRQASLLDASDQRTAAGFAFANDPQAAPAFDGKTWAIHELFPELPIDPAEAEAWVSARVAPPLAETATRHFAHAGKAASTKWNSAVRELHGYFEDDGPALALWKQLCSTAQKQVAEAPMGEPLPNLLEALVLFAREVAKVDGYDLWLRSPAIDQTRTSTTRKCWAVPLRTWMVDEEWQSADGVLKGSHDATGQVRPEYVDDKLPQLYDGDTLNAALLDPDCIEARDWNLSAGQYKPFDFTTIVSEVSITVLIDELQTLEGEILNGLSRLKVMVEGQA